MFSFGRESRKNLKGVHPQLIFILEQSLIYTPIDFGIPKDGGVRTDKRQNQLFLQGVGTKCDGYIKRSKHQIDPRCLGPAYGKAVDFFAYINSKHSYEPRHIYAVCGCILSVAKWLKQEGKVTIKLRWGAEFDSGNLLGWDSSHIEVISDE